MIKQTNNEPIINTLPHLVQHRNVICGKARFRLEDRKKRVIGCDTTTS